MNKISLWQTFRIVFVIFSLYLLGDAFYRWDGFRYYGSISDFLPSVALITVLWSIVALFSALMVYLLIRVVQWLFAGRGLKIGAEQCLFYIGTFLFLGAVIWIIKRNFFHYGTTFLEKLIVLFFLTIIPAFMTWLFRNRAETWINTVMEKVAPLVWLFGIWAVFSVPLTVFHLDEKSSEIISPHAITQADSASGSRKNIILITFDTLTSRDMSTYGYSRETTPFISEWTKKASLFTNLEAESNMTVPTTSSLMTGKRLWTHQSFANIEGYSPAVRSDSENLAQILRNKGYNTIALIVNPMASVRLLGMRNSFDIAPLTTNFSIPYSLSGKIEKVVHQLFGGNFRLYNWIIKPDFAFFHVISILSGELTQTEVPPEIAFDRFLALIDDNSLKPFFAWIHLLPPHTPYLPPEPYLDMFSSFVDKKKKRSWSHKRARYDEFIRYCDRQFEEFVSKLKARNVLKNSVLILSSDHGESFEHGYLGHGGPHLYEQLTHIPLIIKEPYQSRGRVINDVVEQIDIPATILDLAHISRPDWMEGRSLVPLMRGRQMKSQPAFSMSLYANPRGHHITKGTIAVWEENYKLIHYLEQEESLLFDLEKDPDELNNLFEEKPQIGRRLRDLIFTNLKKANDVITGEQ